MDNNTINICFAASNRFAPHAATMITSIMANKLPEDELSFHFFPDKVTPSVLDTFRRMSREMGFQLTIYEKSDEQFADFPSWKGSRTTYFRLSMPRMLPNSLNKVLYLDSDTIVMSSLKDLYSTDIVECYAAVVIQTLRVPHMPVEHAHFNAGMILYNLEKYRNENLEAEAIQCAYKYLDRLHECDQAILNYIFKGNVVYLPVKWNFRYSKGQRKFLVRHGIDIPFSEEELREAENTLGIIHYGDERKLYSFCLRTLNLTMAPYWKYARTTPFYKQILREYFLHYYGISMIRSAIKMPERIIRRWIIKPLRKLLKAV